MDSHIWVKDLHKERNNSSHPSPSKNLLPETWQSLEDMPSSNPHITSLPHHLAYVIYTSGSTGKPKGVLIPHANVHRLLKTTENWYHFNQEDVWTFFHSYAFDFSIWEIWGSLSYGAKLIIVPHLIARSPEAFYKLASHYKVTLLNQTPSAFQQLLQYEKSLNQDLIRSLRHIIFGGEALEFDKLHPWFNKHSKDKTTLINMYGITESTVHVTYRPIDKKDILDNESSNIGKRIPDLQIYILDQNQNLVPIGVSGEIYIGGAGLARGYLNRPDLTAEKFVPNPFLKEEDLKARAENNSGEGQEKSSKSLRLYKTGDMARYLPDGNIEFLGRIDDQVKIRGFRIECGEIASTLASHKDVSQCVVLAKESKTAEESSSKHLVAYVVPSSFKDLAGENISVL